MIHTIAARQAARAGRGGFRSGAQTAKTAAVPRGAPRAVSHRMASSSTQAASQQVKSDAPWAIGSAVIFGSLFVYLTSPKKGGAHGQDDHHDAKSSGGKAGAAPSADDDEEADAPAGGEGEDDSSSSDSEGKEEDDAAESANTSDEEDEYVNVKKIEDKPGEDAPSGARALSERSLTAEEGAHLQKPTKSEGPNPSLRYDDTTFKHGLAHSKEGSKDPGNRDAAISNPKQVVASAHTVKQAKAASAEGHSADEGNKTEDEKNE